MTSEPTTARAVYEQAKRCALARDLAGFTDLFAEDGVHEAPFAPPGVPRRVEGRAALREYVAAAGEAPLTHEAFHDMTVYETTDPEVVIAEYDAHGHVTGGGAYTLRYLQVVRVRGGRIVLWRDYWDPLASAAVMGRVPQILAAYSDAPNA